MPVRSWSTHQLAEFLAEVSGYTDEGAAVRGALERVTVALEAEIAALVRDGSVEATIGFSAGEAPESVLVEAASPEGDVRELKGLGPCRTATAPLDCERSGTLLVARLGDEDFEPEELNLLRAMGRVLMLSLRRLRLLVKERALRQSAEEEATERRRAEWRLATQNAVARVLADADNAREALVPLLRTLAEELGGSTGALWLAGDASLELAAVWPPAQGDALPTGTAEGETLNPPVMPSREPTWESRSRAGAGEADGVLAVPITAGEELAGVIELSGPDRPPPDAQTLAMLTSVGTQVGQFLTRRRAEEQLVHRGLHDGLTGLPNRTLLLDRIERALQRAKRDGSSVALLFLDIDRFKHINDSQGHQAGDGLLVAFAERLVDTLRASDSISRDGGAIARLGGDEFVVLCEQLHTERDAVRVAERIADALADPLSVNGREFRVTASMGIAYAASGRGDAEHMIRDADLAMYRAKDQGRDRHELFDASMRARVLERISLERDLRGAVEDRELRLHYQPIVSTADGTMVATEALLRWEHPERGFVPPDEFVPLAEETGLIVQIGEWVLRTACGQLAEWRRDGIGSPDLGVTINVSSRQLGPQFVATVADALHDTGLDPARLGIEITESLLIEAAQDPADSLSGLKDLGIRLILDDFGTGYSSLSYLHHFPLDALKLDRSFVSGLGRDARVDKLVGAAIEMARALDLGIVAEGVETEDQLARLRKLGCPHAQGYLFARPAPAAEIAHGLSPRAA